MAQKTLSWSFLALVSAVLGLAGLMLKDGLPAKAAEGEVASSSATTSPSPAVPTTDAGKAGLVKLVQQLIDARVNYGQGLHQLQAYYKKMGDAQRETWANRELQEYNTIIQREYYPGLKPSLMSGGTEGWSETDLVEFTLGHRKAYRNNLESLIKVLEEAKDVSNWLAAKQELKELIAVNKYFYLRDADTPGLDLRPGGKIEAAEELYKRAMDLKQNSYPLVVRRYETQLAIETFHKLIDDYPTSDKIDDAAFEIGELCRENLKDYQRAIRWYECVLAWDPDTQLRAAYRIAEIYDKYLVNRLTALEYYKQALKAEPRGSTMYRHIQRKIKRLKGE